jgi:hypothetical protein
MLAVYSSALILLGMIEPPKSLTAEDKKYLDGLMTEFLFDPKGAERVTIRNAVWSLGGASIEGVDGWYVPGTGGKPARVYFTDGWSVPAPPEKERTKVDFTAACRARFELKEIEQQERKKGDPAFDDVFKRMQLTAVGSLTEDELALAAWLYRTGNEPLAAKALAIARNDVIDRAKRQGDKKPDEPRDLLRDQLAWSAFAGLVHAYMWRADDVALGHGERLLRLYPKEAEQDTYRQAKPLVAELKRRKTSGSFGKEPPDNWPDGFDKWEAKKKVVWLIDSLDEVDARQFSQPGSVPLSQDRRVVELIRLGDVAVPGLLDALEFDNRLTRSVHYWRNFSRHRTVLGVREAALTALMSILQVDAFESVSTSDSLSGRGKGAEKEAVSQLRAYWKKYGHLPFDERMMFFLTDPATSLKEKRHAAARLCRLPERPGIDTMGSHFTFNPNEAPPPNPAAAKFQNPTAAEAILAVMVADLKAMEVKPIEANQPTRAEIEKLYIGYLMRLGDKRIVAEAVKRSNTATGITLRRHWAEAAHGFGDPKPFQAIAEEFRRGTLSLRLGSWRDEELEGLIDSFVRVRSQDSELALAAVTDPRHPFHKEIQKLLCKETWFIEFSPLFGHPFCIRMLQLALTDTSTTGGEYTFGKGSISFDGPNGSRGQGIPEILEEPLVAKASAKERICDQAAQRLSDLVAGIPRYHCLLKESDKRLAEQRAALDRYSGGFRKLEGQEGYRLGVPFYHVKFVPDMKPLDRSATEADVKAGKAVFQLAGKGKHTSIPFPAVAILKKDEKLESPAKWLVVQAEIDENGKTIYGLLGISDVRKAPAEEVASLKSMAELEREEKAAQQEREKLKK